MQARATPKPSAPIALALVGAGASTWLAMMPAPRRMHSSEPPSIPSDAETSLDALWLVGARLMPALEIGARFEAWGLLWCVVTCLAATFFAHQLFRGPGRQVAAITAGLTCAVGLGAWVQVTNPRTIFPELPFTVLALLALTAVIRPLVRLGRLTPVAIVRGLAAAAGAAVIVPGAGLPLLVLIGVTCVVRARARRDLPGSLREFVGGARDDDDTSPQKSMTSRGALAGRPAVLALVGLSPLILAAPVAWWGTGPADVLAWLRELNVAVPPIAQLTTYLPPPVSFPALALLVMLVAPLHWRGGVTIVTFAGLSLLFSHHGEPLTPWPTLIALTAVAAAGWVWLAGTLVEGRWPGAALSAAAALVLLGLFAWTSPHLPPARGTEPLAELRPRLRLDRYVERGLLAPGDVLLLNDEEIRDALSRARQHEGWRPDVLVVDPDDFIEADLRLEAFAWVADGRRVLSDSFTVGGRWQGAWAIESGPLYWFVFDVQRTIDQDFEFTPPLMGRVDPTVQAYVARSRLERARYRRAIRQPSMALHALEPWARSDEDWATAVRTAEALRLPADVDSELPRPGRLPAIEEHAITDSPLVDAEVGDLLFQLGDHETGTALLLRAGERGYLAAYGTLVRWELRAGELGVARQHLRQMAEDPALQVELLQLLAWIARNEPPAAALELRDRLPSATPPGAAIAETGARLSVLRALGQPTPAPTPPAAPASADPNAASEAEAERERELDPGRARPE